MRCAVYGLITAVTLVVYAQVHAFDFVNVDDPLYVTANPHVQARLSIDSVVWAFTNAHSGNWQPLTWLSHMLDYQVFGLRPGGHHLVNVLLHIANALLLFEVLRRGTRRASDTALWRSAAVAALFAFHPLHVESVAWVAERKDVLSTFFWLLTMAAYLHYVGRPSARRYVMVATPFALGLMAKSMLVTLPCVLLLMDYWPLRRFENASPWKLAVEKAPLFALSAVFSVIAVIAQHLGESLMSLDAYPLRWRAANAVVSYAAYLHQTFWPRGLAVYYPHPKDTLPFVTVVAAGTLLLALTALAVYWRKRRPYVLVGWLWYLGTLAPVVGLVQIGTQGMADRYTYIPSIGLFLALVWGLAELAAWRQIPRKAAAAAACVALAALAAVTAVQVRHWRNSVTLFEHALRVTSNNHFAHNNLGFALEQLGRTDQALAHYREAVRSDPTFGNARNNLGNLLLERDAAEEAVEQFRAAVAHRPQEALGYVNLAAALIRQRKAKEAVAVFKSGLEALPEEPDLLLNLGNALAASGDTQAAAVRYRQALDANPDLALAHNNLGYLLADEGKLEDAHRHYEQALRIDPALALARNNLGNLLAAQGRMAEAVAQFEAVLVNDAANVPARFNLGNAHLKLEDFEQAVVCYRRVVRQAPNHVNAWNNLGYALARQGNTEEAIRHFREALRLDPNNANAHYNLGDALLDAARTDDAIKHLEWAIELNPSSAEARRKLKTAREGAGPQG